MNLSPRWVDVLRDAGWEAIHWSQVGNPSDRDETVLAWARDNTHVVVTHDLDFGAILAATQARAPSVFQLRTEDISPAGSAALMLEALKRFQPSLESGALVSVDTRRQRARVLPIVS